MVFTLIIKIRYLQEEPPEIEEKPSALEYAVAKYMREHVPRKRTKFLDHPVEYFTASRAVDVLLDSPWASGSDKQLLLFTDRQSVVDFLDGCVSCTAVIFQYLWRKKHVLFISICQSIAVFISVLIHVSGGALTCVVGLP